METSITNNNPHPVEQADRIQTVDMIRGFALLGILLMNIIGFGINWDMWSNILHGPKNTWDYYSFAAIESFFDGTMRGLFSMLFGAGMILFTLNKKDMPGGPTVTEYYYRRLLWLVVFGLFNAFILLWFGDILYFYGLCGMVLFVFRKTNPKWLLVLGLVCMSVTMLKQQLGWNEVTDKRKAYVEAVKLEKEKKILTPEQAGAKAEWQEFEKRIVPDTAFTNRNLRKMRSGYSTIYSYWIPQNVDGEVWGLYHQLIWDGLTMMFIGMALFGWGFFSNRLSGSTYAIWLLIGYGIGIPIGWYAFKNGLQAEVTNLNYYVDRYPVNHQMLYDVRRILLSVGHASLLMMIYRSKLVPWLMKALSNVGQMAFTNYLMQSIICTWFFYGYGFGYYNKLAFHQLYYVVFVVWIFQIIFSAIWMRYFRFGPFEWLWRSLTYWKKQPMKR
ncbi:MAG: DUF418 domain-containing protein [Ferruginibacter sp.]